MRPVPELLARLSRQDSPLTLGADSALDPVELLTVIETMETLSGDMVFGEPPERFLARESLRITSYNVCYTKLLRTG